MPAWKIGTGKRNDISKSGNMTPGPGTYGDNFNKKDSNSGTSKYSFPKDSRNKLDNSKANIGPGAYESKSFIGEAPAYSTKNRYSNRKDPNSFNPGPGAYEMNSFVSSGSRTNPQ